MLWFSPAAYNAPLCDTVRDTWTVQCAVCSMSLLCCGNFATATAKIPQKFMK